MSFTRGLYNSNEPYSLLLILDPTVFPYETPFPFSFEKDRFSLSQWRIFPSLFDESLSQVTKVSRFQSHQ